MKCSPEEQLAYDLIYMSKFQSNCYKNYDRAVWIAGEYIKKHPTASRKAIYLWTIETLNTVSVIPFPEKLIGVETI